MYHGKHNHILGIDKEHCEALLTNLAILLINDGRIETTLVKARALRPFIMKISPLAKRASQLEAMEPKLHLCHLTIARVRDVGAVPVLFNKKL
jgi:large subunit ribosomal protein L17